MIIYLIHSLFLKQIYIFIYNKLTNLIHNNKKENNNHRINIINIPIIANPNSIIPEIFSPSWYQYIHKDYKQLPVHCKKF